MNQIISLIYLFNPLWIFSGRDKLEEEKREEFNYTCIFESCYDRWWPLMKIEMGFCKTTEHIEIKKKIYLAFEWSFSYECSMESTPILSTTFFLSIAIASNQSVREKFYKNFSGKIPVFTQFLLNCIRVGPLDSQFFVSQFKLDWNFSWLSIETGLFGTLYDYEFLQTQEGGFNRTLQWFTEIEKYCSSNELFFKQFVPLSKTPMYSNNCSMSLAGYHQQNFSNFTNPSLVQNAYAKKIYNFLNLIFDARLLTIKETTRDQEQDPLDRESSFLDFYEEFREEQLVSQLFDFIINCNKENLDSLELN